jgi:hypothetical protein
MTGPDTPPNLATPEMQARFDRNMAYIREVLAHLVDDCVIDLDANPDPDLTQLVLTTGRHIEKDLGDRLSVKAALTAAVIQLALHEKAKGDRP